MFAYRSCKIMSSTSRHIASSYLSWLRLNNTVKIPLGVQSVAFSTRQLEWNKQSFGENEQKNKRLLPQTRCLCGTHSVQGVNYVKHLSSSASSQAQIKQGAISRTDDTDSSAFVKGLEYMGIIWKLRYNRFKMRGAAQNLYISCVDDIDVQKFFKACNMDDTLFSWFLVTELHIWMSMVRLRQEGREGKYIIHYLVFCLWHDVEARSKAMGISSVKTKEGLKQMLYQFQAALFAYDEGLLSDDRTMAAALWRTFFVKQCDDPRQVALMVEYVRQQMQYLDTLSSEQLLQTGRVKWLPLNADIPAGMEEPRKAQTIEEELSPLVDVEQIKT
ncbi:ubiquinol-cytochrome-c reductase complex assembly factor 1-like [Amphiura filiformis]|uniref:ubiquinol-cytochrome-c reductase complex assembly factor 1-like n=1 Tax=Amphiura filiformis TaxID=82378 RepID=UPI003B21D7CA